MTLNQKGDTQMLIEAAAVVGAGWFAAKKLVSRAPRLRSIINNMRGVTAVCSNGLVRQIASRLMAGPDDYDIRRKVHMLLDAPLLAVLEHATVEEQEAIISAFARYCERVS